MTSTSVAPRPRRPLPVHPSHAARSGPSEEWARLAEHRGAVVSFLRQRCRDVHEAEDLAHDTLLRASRYIGSLSKVLRPRSWLMQIAVNVQRDMVRKESRIQLRPPSDEAFLRVPGTEPIPGDELDDVRLLVDGEPMSRAELVREVQAAWGHLDPKDRAVLGAYYCDGGSTTAAARAVEVGRSLVKVRLFRARKRLEVELRRRLAKV